MRADRKGNPQCKAIFAMFAQCKEGFPLGGKKTASSLSRKRLMRGDKSALTKGIHSLRAPLTHQARSRTFYRPAPPNQPKNFPVRQPPSHKWEKFSHTNPAVAVQGSSGRVREVWRVGDPIRKGVPCASKVYLTPSPPPPLPWQGVQVLRGWKGFSDAERRGKARRRPS